MKIIVGNFLESLKPDDLLGRYTDGAGISVSVFVESDEAAEQLQTAFPKWVNVKLGGCGGFTRATAEQYEMPGVRQISKNYPDYLWAPGVKFKVRPCQTRWSHENQTTGVRNESGIKRLQAFVKILREIFEETV